jgi:LysR family transcriptional regulator, low CO2-responsive transcriptional regulator
MMAVTFTQLRTFLAVADTGSAHAAAEQLFVTPSAVSASMARHCARVSKRWA